MRESETERQIGGLSVATANGPKFISLYNCWRFGIEQCDPFVIFHLIPPEEENHHSHLSSFSSFSRLSPFSSFSLATVDAASSDTVAAVDISTSLLSRLTAIVAAFWNWKDGVRVTATAMNAGASEVITCLLLLLLLSPLMSRFLRRHSKPNSCTLQSKLFHSTSFSSFDWCLLGGRVGPGAALFPLRARQSSLGGKRLWHSGWH